jgi:small glutamine-rich tetratricopeptide repeat-containing protein alpha
VEDEMAIDESKKAVAVGILDFLTSCIKDGTIASEDRESVEVAIDCVSEVFDVKVEDKHAILGQESLVSLVDKLQKGEVSTPEESTELEAETSRVSEEDRTWAEKLKVEGNRFMAQQRFQDAVDSYTKAIERDGTNAVYYSNRSAAYSSIRESQKAADDAKKAIEIDPSYSKAYSRLGLALYSLGDAQGALEAYEKGIKAEGDSPSDGMRRGYETAKKRVQEDLENSVPSAADTPPVTSPDSTEQTSRGAGAGAGGMPDMSNLFGGGMGGLSQLMNNPQIAGMAQNLMSNPSALSGLLNNPAVQRMQERMGSGQMPSFGELMSDPALQDLARNFMGGQQRQDDEGNQ